MPKVKYSLEARRQSGVYAIVNKVTGCMYIGQTSFRFSERWANHCVGLRQGKHGNAALQRDWNTYGADAFEFRILEGQENGRGLVMDYYAAERRWLAAATAPLYNKFDDR